MKKSYYKYKYLNNGSYWKNEDDGGQPGKGLIAIHGLLLNILIYNRKLHPRELKKYNLELIEIIKQGVENKELRAGDSGK